MKKRLTTICFLATALVTSCTAVASAGEIQIISGSSLPPLIQVSGTLTNRIGTPYSGTVGVTFALYQEQEGGNPLWLETQNVQLDQEGHYSISLGSTHPEGLPVEFFSSNVARWLGVQVLLPGEQEQPRSMLVSVPYAIKASDSDTLGGRPASAYVLADSLGNKAAVLHESDRTTSTIEPVSIPDASPIVSGLMNTTEQIFAGTKSFLSPPVFSSTIHGSLFFAGVGGVLSQDSARLAKKSD